MSYEVLHALKCAVTHITENFDSEFLYVFHAVKCVVTDITKMQCNVCDYTNLYQEDFIRKVWSVMLGTVLCATFFVMFSVMFYAVFNVMLNICTTNKKLT